MSLREDSRNSLLYLGIGSCLGVCFGLYFVLGFSNFLNSRIKYGEEERDSEENLRIPEYRYSPEEIVQQERRILVN